MSFPLLNVSNTNWHQEDDIAEFILTDDYITTADEALFDHYYRNRLFCDTNGNLYRVTDRIPPAEKWRTWFKFIPTVFKVRLVFQKLDRKYGLEELKSFMLDRIAELEKDDFNVKWKKQVEQATTHHELITGDTK